MPGQASGPTPPAPNPPRLRPRPAPPPPCALTQKSLCAVRRSAAWWSGTAPRCARCCSRRSTRAARRPRATRRTSRRSSRAPSTSRLRPSCPKPSPVRSFTSVSCTSGCTRGFWVEASCSFARTPAPSAARRCPHGCPFRRPPLTPCFLRFRKLTFSKKFTFPPRCGGPDRAGRRRRVPGLRASRPLPSRTKWTRLVHPSVLIGHVSSPQVHSRMVIFGRARVCTSFIQVGPALREKKSELLRTARVGGKTPDRVCPLRFLFFSFLICANGRVSSLLPY
jgi:hypothetical protein